MGSVELVTIFKTADQSNSRILSAYQDHECGVSRIRLASHHPSVAWLRGFETLALSYHSYLAVAAIKSTTIGSED